MAPESKSGRKHATSKSRPARGATRIGVTVGDPAGVGPEVALKALVLAGDGGEAPFATQAPCVLLGPLWVFQDIAARLSLPVEFEVITKAALSTLRPARLEKSPGGRTQRPIRLPVLEPLPRSKPAVILYGEESGPSGEIAYRAIVSGARLCLSGQLDAIATAPISKAALHAAGRDFPGHTELLQHEAGGAPVRMLLAGGGLRVALVTIHEALAEVPRLVTRERILDTLRILHEFLGLWEGRAPRIGVCGLNPHAGEGGLFGDEEIRTIAPVIAEAKAAGLSVEGPLPADTIFHLAREGRFDGIAAMYHDQALIPIKTLDFDGGVNITMGLPFIRTSPDHGTAFGIAGKGIARQRSMRNALEAARSLSLARAAARSRN